MAKTKFDVLQERVMTFARKYQVPVEETAISGNHGLLGISEVARQSEDMGVVSTIHLLVNPQVVLGDDSTVFNSGLWCGMEYMEENFSSPTALGVFSEEKINILAYPLWNELGRVERDGLWFADRSFLIKAKTLSVYNKHQLGVFNSYVEQLGHTPSRDEEEYLDAVSRFDAYYHYSDDGSVYRAGLAQEENLKRLAAKLPNHQILWAIAKGEKK